VDEFTANPYETEKEAQRVLRKMQADKNVAAAKAAEGKAAVEESRAKLREMGYLKGGSGSAAGLPKSGKHEMLKFSKGGSASSRADGCCVKGKTRGRMV
jgi:predicted RecB family endonuclease